MTKDTRVEYWIHDHESFFILPPNKWRDAKRLASECKQGLHPEISLIERVETIYNYDECDGYELINRNHSDLFDENAPYCSDCGELISNKNPPRWIDCELNGDRIIGRTCCIEAVF